ncbi:trk system potassium uptake protein TrkA [Natranaerovirga hydrolytica]|uniref:Trk system potassium uptake protein TrkA n=1 Tax=Natranaerovirga hydrolytica TaxID=680378 RepID=A0A4R1MDM2_9FIRM|nr:TrkA family potassium uptake protein [Natranaerovirga hydrolytica]TCK90566.1 trk system potassium uptake protein TrkA [Natranaerovirga hydrolytica]
MGKTRDFVVFGMGKFGRSIAESLTNNGCEVLVIDKSDDIIQDVSDIVTHAVQADVTDIDALNALGIRNFDVAIIAISQDMQSSIMATILTKELGVPHVIAKASNDIHKKVLEKVGADRVVFPEREMGVRIANSLVSENFLDFIELSPDYSLVEISVMDEWVDKTLKDINMRANYGINVMAIRKGDDINITPGPDVELHKEDVLVVIGSNSDLMKINDTN